MKIDFSKYSSVRIGGIFDVEVLDEMREFDGVIIGGANNLLISPNPPKMAYPIRISIPSFCKACSIGQSFAKYSQ